MSAAITGSCSVRATQVQQSQRNAVPTSCSSGD